MDSRQQGANMCLAVVRNDDGPRSCPARPAPVRIHDRVPHHLPELHHRAVGIHRDAAGALVRDRPRAPAPPGAILDQDFRGVVRHGRRVRDRAQLPVRHQLEPLLGRRRQRHRPADRLRGADRLLPRSDPSSACMLFGWKRVPPWLHVLSAIIVAVGTAISAFWILSANSWMQTPAGHEVRDGIAFPVDWLAIIFNPSFPYRLPHMLAAAYLTTSLVVLAVGARYLLAGKHADGSPHHAAYGHRHAGAARADPGFHRRPARAQYARASADQDRRHGGTLGRQQAGRARAVRLAGREDGDEPASRSRSRMPARSSSPTRSTASIPA